MHNSTSTTGKKTFCWAYFVYLGLDCKSEDVRTQRLLVSSVQAPVGPRSLSPRAESDARLPNRGDASEEIA
jgi:hypothetical protein